jgi:hypothetical protein
MTTYVETYTAPKHWHRDSKVVLKWIQTKAHTNFKKKLLCEEDVIVAVIDMLAKPEYGDIDSINLPSEVDLQAAVMATLELKRSDACKLINELTHEHGVNIRDAVKASLK